MSITNTILVIVGIFVVIIGLLSFINPTFSRLINAPGGSKLKAIIAFIIGLIIIIIGFIVQLPG